MYMCSTSQAGCTGCVNTSENVALEVVQNRDTAPLVYECVCEWVNVDMYCKEL